MTRQARFGPGVAAATLLVGGCVSSSPLPVPPSRTDAEPVVIDAPRSARGNPNFYEVFGRRYHVMPSAEGYRENGVASWYGRDFHGRSTSSGERYDMFALTAAHKSLPLPTWVEVTNRTNGKKVIVKVNDRGPFVGNRIIDLSYAAALELDMITAGTASVSVRALGVPAALPDPQTRMATASPTSPPVSNMALAARPAEPRPVEPRPPVPAAERTFVQVGAFSEPANASRVRAVLESAGVGGVHVHAPDTPAGGVHRVHVGPVSSESEFDLVRGKLRALGFADGHLVLERFFE